MTHGRLVLVPAWLSEDTPPEAVVPAPALERIRMLDSFVVEEAKSARRFLAACGHPRPMREIAMVELNEHTPASAVPAMLDPALQGRDLGLLSEAGIPAVADPGALLVAAAHQRGVRVVPLVGPSSVMLALEASGLEGQRFRFVGYLPADGNARRAAIAELERQSSRHAETQIFIETPYRNAALWEALTKTLQPTTRLAIGSGLTLATELTRSLPVSAWRQQGTPVANDTPAVFAIGR